MCSFRREICCCEPVSDNICRMRGEQQDHRVGSGGRGPTFESQFCYFLAGNLGYVTPALHASVFSSVKWGVTVASTTWGCCEDEMS